MFLSTNTEYRNVSLDSLVDLEIEIKNKYLLEILIILNFRLQSKVDFSLEGGNAFLHGK